MSNLSIPKTADLVNYRNKGRVRCPKCEFTREIGAFCPWISPAGKMVCFYGVCSKCADEVQKTPVELRTFVLDKVERSLLRWYPFLSEKLPGGYRPKEEGEGKQ